MHSGSFDRAAHIYDETRGFPPGVGDLVAEAAEGLLAGRLAVLAIGVGTGRIARPLLARGVRVTGRDGSGNVVAAPPSLVQGAAEALPLASASFDAVLSVHVLHLIPAWQASLAEMRRVLRPGGVILSGYDWRSNDAPGARLMERWRQFVAERSSESIQSATGRGTHAFQDIKAELLAAGPRFDAVM